MRIQKRVISTQLHTFPLIAVTSISVNATNTLFSVSASLTRYVYGHKAYHWTLKIFCLRFDISQQNSSFVTKAIKGIEKVEVIHLFSRFNRIFLKVKEIKRPTIRGKCEIIEYLFLLIFLTCDQVQSRLEVATA